LKYLESKDILILKMALLPLHLILDPSYSWSVADGLCIALMCGYYFHAPLHRYM